MSWDTTSNGSLEPNLYDTLHGSVYKNRTILNIHFALFCLMKSDGVNLIECFICNMRH